MAPRALDDGLAAGLERLRAAVPEAVIGALDRHSDPVPVPEELLELLPPRRPGDPDVPAGLEGVDPDDRVAVLRAYERARSTGATVVAVRLVNGERVHLHFLDARDRYGVVLVVTTPQDHAVPALEPAEGTELVRARVCWARLDGQGTVLEADPATEDLFGWTPAEITGTNALPQIHPDDQERAIDNWLQVVTSPGEKRRYRCRHLCKDGSYVWTDITNHNRLEDPQHRDVYSEILDVSDEMRMHEELAEREQLLRVLIDALPTGVVQFDADRSTIHGNDRFDAIVGASGIEGLLGVVDEGTRAELVAGLDAVAAGVAPEPIEVHLAGDRVCRVSLRPLLAGGGLACVDDVTEAVRLRRALELQATFDALTSCFSRTAILGALRDATGTEPGTGVVFVDLDRFKPVNDQFGHAAGDELLATVGARLREAVRDVDLVGRLGGDEFLVVCPGVEERADVESIARRIAELLAEPLALTEDYLVRPRASIGVAWAPAGTDAATLVARADAAMYESKRNARLGVTTLTIAPA